MFFISLVNLYIYLLFVLCQIHGKIKPNQVFEADFLLFFFFTPLLLHPAPPPSGRCWWSHLSQRCDCTALSDWHGGNRNHLANIQAQINLTVSHNALLWKGDSGSHQWRTMSRWRMDLLLQSHKTRDTMKCLCESISSTQFTRALILFFLFHLFIIYYNKLQLCLQQTTLIKNNSINDCK